MIPLAITEERLKHMLGVARSMYSLAKKCGYSEEEAQELFVTGLVHDVGYEFSDGEHHAFIGGEILKRTGFKYWKEVELHGFDCGALMTEELHLLNTADMCVAFDGEPSTLAQRLDSIQLRYGSDSKVYSEACRVAERVAKFQKQHALEEDAL